MKAGDVVTLKSGGPHMTVVSLDKETANVVWFTGNSYGEFFDERRATFPLLTLWEVAQSGDVSLPKKKK